MTSNIYLMNTPSFVLCQTTPGKPDPHQPYTIEEKDNRQRVLRSAFEVGDSWHEVINMLRFRVGKKHPPELKNAREIELIFSECLKQIRMAYKMQFVPKEKDLPQPYSDDHPMQLTHQEVKHIFDMNHGFGVFLHQMDERRQLSRLKDEFLKQSTYSKLGDYEISLMREKKAWELKRNAIFNACNAAMEKLLAKFEIDVSLLFEHDKKSDSQKCFAVLDRGAWKNLTTDQKLTFLQIYLRRESIKKYGLHVSKWLPTDTISTLIAEIKSHGPLCVGGTLGKKAYSVAPFALKDKVCDRTIYGWTKMDSKPEADYNAILIIGARSSNSDEYVYFIDPYDPSDPKRPEEQPIYVTRYTTLVSNITDLEGVLRLQAPNGVGYAVHA